MTTHLLIDGVQVDCREIDWHLGVGIEANGLMRALLERTDLELRAHNGQLKLAYHPATPGEEWSPEIVTGVASLEPTIADWQDLAARLALIAPRPAVAKETKA